MANQPCPICGQQVGDSQAMFAHLIDDHDKTEDEVLVQYPSPGLFCQICGETLDLSKAEFVRHLRGEHDLDDDTIQIKMVSDTIRQADNQVPPVIRENFDRVMDFLEDLTGQHDSRTNQKLWIRAILIGGVVLGVFIISWEGILGDQTITSLVSVIVGYLLAREAI